MLCKLRKFKKKHHFFREGKEMILRRKSDNTLWVASHNGRVYAMLAFIGEADRFYFRRCKPFRDGYIIDWEQIWQHDDAELFKIVSTRK